MRCRTHKPHAAAGFRTIPDPRAATRPICNAASSRQQTVDHKCRVERRSAAGELSGGLVKKPRLDTGRPL
eukprot:scaffold10567_cov56-Phaeocystis_antarctica.AAC.2